MKYAGVLLAAGQSSRMRGRDKLMELIDGVPQLLRMIEACAPHVDCLAVTLPSLDHTRASLLTNQQVPLPVPDATLGLSASIKIAAKWALQTDVDHLMIMPSDMPELDSNDIALIQKMARQNPNHLVQGTTQSGKPGHPVSFPKDLFPELLTLTGDQGAKALIQANKSRLIKAALAGTHAITDLDTPEEWTNWRLVRSNSTPKNDL